VWGIIPLHFLFDIKPFYDMSYMSYTFSKCRVIYVAYPIFFRSVLGTIHLTSEVINTKYSIKLFVCFLNFNKTSFVQVSVNEYKEVCVL